MWMLLVAFFAAEPLEPPTLKTLDEIQIRDPFILPVKEEGVYYLYGTGRPLGERGFDAYKSEDLKHWEGPFPVFRPSTSYWGQRDFWAPEVHFYQGRYYLFGTFSPKGEGPRGTAVLVADHPEGPFMPHSEGPVTPQDWYALDGTLFVDDEGQPWMVFCHEWVQIGDGAMCAVRLSQELSRPVGTPVTLFHASKAPWVRELGAKDKKGHITDGPWIHKNTDDSLLMLWSSFGEGGNYMTATARSASGSITGPWTLSEKPIFEQDGGHPMLFETFDGILMLTLHHPNSGRRERAQLFVVTVAEEEIHIERHLEQP